MGIGVVAGWIEAEPSAEKKYPGAVVGEGPEAPGVGLDGPYSRVEALGQRVGYAVAEVAEQTGEVRLEGGGHLLDRKRSIYTL